MRTLSQMEALELLLAKPEFIQPVNQMKENLAIWDFGLEMVCAIGASDIGQTVVVKDRAVMAVGGIEGTDVCILRGGQLARGGAVVAKAAKPQQDHRYDVPTVGPDTIQTMIKAGATAMVVKQVKLFFDAKAGSRLWRMKMELQLLQNH